MVSTERPWSATVRLEDVPEAGRHVALEADETTRAALAAPVGVDAVESLTATFDLARRGHDGMHVAGRVAARVRQTCVVTLEPVVNEIDEAVDVDFAPPRDPASVEADDHQTNLVRAAADPEPLVNSAVDLGLLATEFLILGVDPYPRKPGVSFAAPEPAADFVDSPFAALAKWKKNDTVKK